MTAADAQGKGGGQLPSKEHNDDIFEGRPNVKRFPASTASASLALLSTGMMTNAYK